MQESDRTRNHSQQLSEENQTISLRCEQIQRELERAKNQIISLQQDVANQSNRTIAVQAEHREVCFISIQPTSNYLYKRVSNIPLSMYR